MTAGEFAYWLQGALELNPDMLEKGMTSEQVKTVQDHLNLVFTKVTPDRFKKEEEEEEEEQPVLPNFPYLNFPILDPDWNTPLCGKIVPGVDESQLFCSQVNSNMEFPKEEGVYTTGCTTNLYSIGDNDEPMSEIVFKTSLLKIC